MSNTILIVLCIVSIIIIGHLYIKNMAINPHHKPKNPFQRDSSNKKVTFGDKEIRYIPGNETLQVINDIVPPDNIIINDHNDELKNTLKDHIDSIYESDSIIYDEKVYKKDTLSGKPDDTQQSFSHFGSNTDYFPYNKNEREKINKYNKQSPAHFTDDNFDLGSFFNENQEFNDTTSPFVDNSKYNQVKQELNQSNVLVAPPLVNDGIDPQVNCDPYNNIMNSNRQLNKELINKSVVDVDGLSLESWQYSNENINNGGAIVDGLSAFNGFNDIYSDIQNVSEGKCHQ